MDNQLSLTFRIVELTAGMLASVHNLRLEFWMDTYVNGSSGVIREWVLPRSKAFLEQPGSVVLCEGDIPEVMMIREGEKV